MSPIEPPGFTGPTFGSLISQAIQFVSRWFSNLFGINKTADIRETVALKFPSIVEPTLSRVIVTGNMANQAADILANIQPHERVSREAIPRDRNLPPGTAYRYQVAVDYRIEGAEKDQWTTVYVDSKKNLTQEEVEKLAREQLELLLIKYKKCEGDRKGCFEAEPHTVNELHFVSIFRRSAL